MINLIYTVLPTITLIVGFYIGFSIKKEDKFPPIKIIKEKQEEKEKAQEIKALETYMENIDNYPDNQKDIKE